jgi:hypothetical protein
MSTANPASMEACAAEFGWDGVESWKPLDPMSKTTE